MKEIKKKILLAAKRSGRKGYSKRELRIKSHLTAKEQADFAAALDALIASGELVERKGRFLTTKRAGLHPAEVLRINKTFGFARQLADDREIFIPGKYLKGALPGDLVMVRYIPARQEDGLEGEVVTITEHGSGCFTGVLLREDGRYFVLPDSFTRFPIPVVKGKYGGCKPGDKVTAQVILRGVRHADHRCMVTSGFGSSEKAAACAKALLQVNGINEDFSPEAMEQAEMLAKRGICQEDFKNRLDLRDIPIFTIDSADSKDLDDAVSLEKREGIYHLGVHIADVSHYVTAKSPLDEEAFMRGTSLYYADQVVPMLPKALSNGICSLNPSEDRLAFSALLQINAKGELLDYTFKKTIIRSRIKGIYSEINAVLDGSATVDVKKKYRDLTDQLALMEELADLLADNKRKRGAPEIETKESKILIDKDGLVCDIKLRERGKSERIIEEFMLMANQAAASLGRKLALPFVYRIHEPPVTEKVEQLKEILHLLGISAPKIKGQVQPGQLAAVLKEAKGSKYDALINNCVLRSMAKARYSEEPLGHFGLVLQDYAHFTSPIRRYPDLAIHRIMSALIANGKPALIQKKYQKFAISAALQSTRTELRAMQIERGCEDCYKAEYMMAHLKEVFDGVVSSVAAQGIYVELPNTVEGLVRTESLGEGYQFDGLLEMKSPVGRSYRIGDSVRVQCVRADVNSGQIDFELAE